MTQNIVENSVGIKNRPSFMYKYRALDSISLSYVEQTLRHDEIYFASPVQFNDPFDCKVHWSFNASDDVFREYYDRLLQRKSPNLDIKERQRRISEWIEQQKHRSPDFQQELISDMQQAINKLGIFCLTEKRDDILMWSHYAGGHTGICLEFDVGLNSDIFLDAEKVGYATDYPGVDIILDSPKQQVEAILFTKAEFWKYEKEWRIINYEKGSGTQRFRSDLLTGVILGCQISNENRKLIGQLVNERAYRPRLYEVRVHNGSFRLEIVQIG